MPVNLPEDLSIVGGDEVEPHSIPIQVLLKILFQIGTYLHILSYDVSK